MARTSFERATRRLRLRLFACGVGDVAELRGWSRWMHWRRRPTLRWRAGLVRDLAALPARAAREARAAVHEYGAEIAREGGGSRARQLTQLWWLRARHGIDADAYLMFQLYRPERRRRAAEYVQVRELNRVTRLTIGRRGGGPEARMLSDKRAFVAWCDQHDLARIATLLEVDAAGVVGDVSGSGVLPARDLFSKPVRGQSGLGARLWRTTAGGHAEGDGRALQPAELVAELAAMAQALDRTILVQPCVRTHRDLDRLTPGGLCTMRIVTFRPAVGGPVALLMSAFKMPAGDAVVDNVAQGAVVAHVDQATGRLGAAVRQCGGLFITAECHPDTGARIGGTQLPDWAATVDLVTRAHRATEHAVLLGWDVAITDDGPVLIEGNTLPGSRIMQLVTDGPLTDTPLVRGLNRLLREEFGI